MGLDMYLYANRYSSEYFGADLYPELKALAERIGLPLSRNMASVTITTEAAYWRKANQIHAWFVDNVQDGEDRCLKHGVSLEQLRELHELCAELLESRDVADARDRLPTKSGFFFGSTDIDEYYWEDLKLTVDQLAPIISHPKAAEFDFTYHSSW